GRHDQHLDRQGGELVVEIEPPLELRHRCGLTRVGDGEPAKLVELATVGGGECVVGGDDLGRRIVVKQLVEGDVQAVAALQYEKGVARQRGAPERDFAHPALAV